MPPADVFSAWSTAGHVAMARGTLAQLFALPGNHTARPPRRSRQKRSTAPVRGNSAGPGPSQSLNPAGLSVARR
jgi:hypothetical protein